MRRPFPLALIVSLTLALGTATAQKQLRGNVFDGQGGPLTQGVYEVVGAMSVPAGKTLTIQKGAWLKFRPTRLVVSGKITGNGAIFTSIKDDSDGNDTGKDGPTTGKPGDWEGIEVHSSGNVSLVGCELRFTGHFLRPALWFRGSGKVDVRSCRFVNTGANGLVIEEATGPVQGCTFSNTFGFPFQAPLQQAQNYKGNRASKCRLTDDMTFNVPRRMPWPATGITLSAAQALTTSGVVAIETRIVNIPPTSSLTIATGTIVKMSVGSTILAHDTVFVMNGTLTSVDDDALGGIYDKVKQPRKPKAGEGPGISVDGSRGRAVLRSKGGVLRYGGGLRATISAIGDVTLDLDSVTISDSSTDGVYILSAGKASNYRLQNCRFVRCGFPVVGLPIESLHGRTGNVAIACRDNHFVVASDMTTAGMRVRIHPSNYPGDYLIVASNVVVKGGTFEIAGGAELRFTTKLLSTVAGIQVSGGRFAVVGGLNKPVKFTSYFVDPKLRAAAPGDWNGVVVLGKKVDLDLAGTTIEFAENGLRYMGSEPVRPVIRRVRVERSKTNGISIAGSGIKAVENCVVNRATYGITIASATNIVHCSAYNCSLYGMVKTGSHTAKVFNSISDRSGRANYFGFTASDVHSSIGGFQGKNKNTTADPKLDSQQRPLPGSPAIDSGDARWSNGLEKGIGNNPRVLDGKLKGAFLPDRGAYEYSKWRSVGDGTPTPGGRLEVRIVQGPTALTGYFLGFGGPTVVIPGFGRVNVGLIGFLPLAWQQSTQKLVMPLPNDTRIRGIELRLQPLVIASVAPLRGNLLEVHRFVIH